jgi:hypothetical protein
MVPWYTMNLGHRFFELSGDLSRQTCQSNPFELHGSTVWTHQRTDMYLSFGFVSDSPISLSHGTMVHYEPCSQVFGAERCLISTNLSIQPIPTTWMNGLDSSEAWYVVKLWFCVGFSEQSITWYHGTLWTLFTGVLRWAVPYLDKPTHTTHFNYMDQRSGLIGGLICS